MKTKIHNTLKNKYVKAGLWGLAFIFTVVVLILIFRKTPVKAAKQYLGQEEKSPNKGFKSSNFENQMKSIGWSTGSQWCAYFARLVWLKSLKGQKYEIAKKLLSGSSQQTFKNFQNDSSGLFRVSQKPKVGSIVIWQSTKDASRGHAGIVKKVTAKGFETIEGNSNSDGSPGKVAHLVYTFGKNPKYLKLRGFINIA